MTPANGTPANDGALLVVVPSRRAAAQVAEAAIAAAGRGAELASSAIWTHSVVTLRELVERGAVAHPAPRPILRGAAFQLFVAGILEQPGSRARSLLGPGMDAAGAARAIATAIAEVRMANLGPADLENAAGEARGAARRLMALADVLRRYESRLEESGRWDGARLHREVTLLVRDGVWPAEIDRLEIRGLYDVTPLQAELLMALAERSRSVLVEVPFDPHDDQTTAFAFPYVKMWEAWDDPARDFEPSFLPPSGDGHEPEIAFAAAADTSDEARLVADWARARGEEGCPLEEIVIITAGGARRLGPIARELVRRGIPFHARRGAPLAETPLFAALLLPFRLFEEGFRRTDLMSWVTSPLTTRLDPDLLRASLARGPVGGGRLGEWNKALSVARGESAAIVTSALRDLDGLARMEAPPSRFWSDYTSVLARVGLDPSSSPFLANAWGAWDDVLAELREALEAVGSWDGPPVGWRTHRRHLAAVMSDRRTSEGRTGRGIAILTPQDARGLYFRHAAVIGLVQGSLVSPRPGAAILGDAERAALNEALGRSLFRLAAEDAREGSLLLRERLHGTTGKLLLLFSTTDDDGNPLLPALELETLRQKLGAQPWSRPAHDPPWRIARPAEQVAALQRIERDRTSFFAIDADVRARSASRYDGAFDAASAEALRPELEGEGRLALWSASRLETWRQCPHQYFQKYVLGLAPPDEMALEAEPATIGRAVHIALEDLSGTPMTMPPERGRIEDALRRAAEHPDIKTIDRGHPEVWSAIQRRAVSVLERYFRYLWDNHPPGALEVMGREIAFGPGEEDLPPVMVETALGRVGLRGRVDRIDRDPGTNEMQVVDYKFSKADRHRAAVDPDRCGMIRFQLYVYMLAARDWAAREGLPAPTSLRGLVHCLREPSVLKLLPWPGEGVIERRIADVIEEAARSVFDASPREPDDCRFCDFRRSCRIATVAGPLQAGLLEDEL